jgi:hypothetical protein
MSPVQQIYLTMRRNIALGKLHVFEEECWKLANFVRSGVLNKQRTIDELQSVADTNSLTNTFGEDLIAALMREAFAEPESVEVAA